MIYFAHNVTLKIKIYEIMTKNERINIIRTLLLFLNDNTLLFVVFYCVFLSLALTINYAYITLILLDYFLRFKFANTTISLLRRSFLNIFYIILIVFEVLYVFSLAQLSVRDMANRNCSHPIGCTQ